MEVSCLQEYAAKQRWDPPSYVQIPVQRRSVLPKFQMEVTVKGHVFRPPFESPSLHQAKVEAAKMALQFFKVDLKGKEVVQLQEWAAAMALPLPSYHQVSRTGPSHMPQFIYAVAVDNQTFTGTYPAKNVALAKAEAARVALESVTRQSGPKSRSTTVTSYTAPDSRRDVPPPRAPMYPPAPEPRPVSSIASPLTSSIPISSQNARHEPCQTFPRLGDVSPLRNENIASYISVLYELSIKNHATIADHYPPSTAGFQCYFTWNDDFVFPMSEFCGKKKEAKVQAARLALEHIKKLLGIKNEPAVVTKQSSSSSASDMSPQAMDIDSKDQTINPALSEPTNPVSRVFYLHQRSAMANPKLKPEFEEVPSTEGFQFNLVCDGKIMAQSDTFSKKQDAKTDAAQKAYDKLDAFYKSVNPFANDKKGLSAEAMNELLEDMFDPFNQNSKFQKKITPNTDIKKSTILIISSLYHELKYGGLKVKRMVCGGSYGRNTALVHQYDIQITLFFDFDETDTVESIQESVKQIILLSNKAHRSVKDGLGNLELEYRGVQSLNMEIVIGRHLADFNEEEDVDVRLIKQSKKVRATLAEKGSRLSEAEKVAWSAPLAECMQEFFRNKADSVPLTRLLRLWYSFALLKDPFESDLYILDLLSIWCYEKTEEQQLLNKSCFLLTAFERALTAFKNWKTLRIYWTDYYKKSDVPYELWASDKPLLLDPTILGLNLIRAEDEKSWNALAGFAELTLKKLENWKTTRNDEANFLSSVFELNTAAASHGIGFSCQPSFKKTSNSSEVETEIMLPQFFSAATEDSASKAYLSRVVGNLFISYMLVKMASWPNDDKLKNVEWGKFLEEIGGSLRSVLGNSGWLGNQHLIVPLSTGVYAILRYNV
ncbi:hypothetical protein HDV05_007992 [Chytridiales sp. JEL 0842]|nr:hypothetical protein HDV05_007992 [Chytridiales sp. JEL 0842]